MPHTVRDSGNKSGVLRKARVFPERLLSEPLLGFEFWFVFSVTASSQKLQNSKEKIWFFNQNSGYRMTKHKISTALPFLFHRFCSAWDFGVSQTLNRTHKMCQWKEQITVWRTGNDLVCIVVFLATYTNGFYFLYTNLLHNSSCPQLGLESCHESSKIVLKLWKSWILLSILYSCRKFLANISMFITTELLIWVSSI